MRQAEDVLRLAVAAERAAATSWQDIGERLDVTRQSAHERFARASRRSPTACCSPTATLLTRAGWAGGRARTASMTPRAPSQRLDAWALRHREPTDVERGEHPVSGGLRRRPQLQAIEAIGVVSALAKRVLDGDLPAGVSERRARRTLLERKLEAFDLIARRESGKAARDALAQQPPRRSTSSSPGTATTSTSA